MKYFLLCVLFFATFQLSNAEKQWVRKHFRADEHVRAIKCFDSANIAVIVESVGESMIYKSYDAGNTWKNTYRYFHPAHGDSLAMLSVGSFILDSLHYYICMFPQPVIDVSSDGGNTFKRIEFGTISSDKKNYIFDLNMADSLRGYLITRTNIILTQDGWKSFEIYEKPYKFISTNEPSFYIDSVNIALMKQVAGSNLFYKFNTITYEWSTYSNEVLAEEGDFPYTIIDLDFLNDSTIIGAGFQRVNDTTKNIHYDLIWKSTDKGVNWEVIYKKLKNPRFGLEKISFTDSLRGIAGGNGAKYMLTEDGGKTWKYVILMDYLYASSQNCTYCGDYPIAWFPSGGIFRYEDVTGITEGILEEINIKPYQTKTEYYLEIHDPKSREYEIIFSDANGKQILTQTLNTAIAANTSPIDLNSLNSGTYFYMITCNNSLISTGKFVNAREQKIIIISGTNKLNSGKFIIVK